MGNIDSTLLRRHALGRDPAHFLEEQESGKLQNDQKSQNPDSAECSCSAPIENETDGDTEEKEQYGPDGNCDETAARSFFVRDPRHDQSFHTVGWRRLRDIRVNTIRGICPAERNHISPIAAIDRQRRNITEGHRQRIVAIAEVDCCCCCGNSRYRN